MTVQLELWQLITLLLTFLGATWAFGKALFSQIDKRLDERFSMQEVRFTELRTSNADEARQWQRIERDLLTLRGDLPKEYMRREDHIRSETVTNAKLDALATRQDLFSERMSAVLAVLKKD